MNYKDWLIAFDSACDSEDGDVYWLTTEFPEHYERYLGDLLNSCGG